MSFLRGFLLFFIIFLVSFSATASTFRVPSKSSLKGFKNQPFIPCKLYNQIKKDDSIFGRCEDGSISYAQPDSEPYIGFKNGEGRCGPTAAANLLHQYCGLTSRVSAYVAPFLYDLTPGVSTKTFLKGINDIFSTQKSGQCPSGDWKLYRARSRTDYLNILWKALRQDKIFQRIQTNGAKVNRSPVSLIIAVDPVRPLKTLHWVTVVDIENINKPSCTVFANTWKRQYRVPCRDFINYSEAVPSFILNQHNFTAFSMVWFKPS